MHSEKVSIDKDFYFNLNRNITAGIVNTALRQFAECFEEAKKLNGDYPIFIDTNILLGYYGMSQNEKGKLIQFLTQYKERIHITSQIQNEYLRNRLSVIKKDFFGTLSKISEDFSNVKKQTAGIIKNFKESKKSILAHDYPDLWNKLEDIEKAMNSALNDPEFNSEIEKQIDTTTQNNKNIAFIDELLALVSKMNITEPLEELELDFLKSEFEKLLKDYKDAKENVKWKFAVPGCGDKKDDPSGDYIIFHEILKFMKDNSKSCIFLTNDVTKGDWLQIDKNQHCHYIEHAFLKTGKSIFIIHAAQVLPYISFESVYKDEDSMPSLVDVNDNSVVADDSFKSTTKRTKGPSNAPTINKDN